MPINGAGGAGAYALVAAEAQRIYDARRNQEREMLMQLRRNRAAYLENDIFEEADEFDVGPAPGERHRGVVNNPYRNNMDDVVEVLKVRHLTKGERDAYHQPKPDWHDTKKGDVCKSASTLEVDDILVKHKVI